MATTCRYILGGAVGKNGGAVNKKGGVVNNTLTTMAASIRARSVGAGANIAFIVRHERAAAAAGWRSVGAQ
jgi:hypothetical protein